MGLVDTTTCAWTRRFVLDSFLGDVNIFTVIIIIIVIREVFFIHTYRKG